MKKSKSQEYPKILKDILKHNDNPLNKVKIRVRELKSSYSLYLDFCKDGKREYENLKVRIPKDNKLLKISNNDQIRIIMGIVNEKTSQYFQDFHNFQLKDKFEDMDFISYVEKTIDERTHGNYRAMQKHLEKFTKGSLKFREVTPAFCESFKEYLDTATTLNSKNKKKLSKITIKYYLRSLSAILNRAVKDGYIQDNPNKHVRVKNVEAKKEYLSFDEVIEFYNVETKFEESKNCFVFGCLTGLRISDLKSLKFSEHINGDRLVIKQTKTGSTVTMKLHPLALRILDRQREKHPRSNQVFHLIYQGNVQEHIEKIRKKTSIQRHLTMHTSRHTFATLLLNSGAGIKTVSDLLGHRDLRTTLVYAKLTDLTKDKAIDDLPKWEEEKNSNDSN
jgi:integrase